MKRDPCTSGCFLLCLLLSVAVVFSESTVSDQDAKTWSMVTGPDMDRATLTPHGQQTLDDKNFRWQHAQTTHFVLHFEQAIFARKVARMAEFFFDYIQSDLQGLRDRAAGRSHIFVFRHEAAWRKLVESRPDIQTWTFSMVEGPVMYVQQADQISASGGVLAHEMTHLVMNRFIEGHAPLWLNEGLAEFYGAFAYSAFKGIKKSRRAQFTRLETPYPLEALFNAETYPADPRQVRAFYATARQVVGFLMLERNAAVFPTFIDRLSKGDRLEPALQACYGFASMESFVKEFQKFAQ